VAFFKALLFGAFLTWIVSMFVGSTGSSGGHLEVQRLMMADYSILWSWPLFIAGTGLAWGILWLME
jgi:hypothetical protein